MDSTDKRFCHNASQLWIIVLLLPNARHRIIAGFHNRQDADDHLRFLQRAVPAAKFEIIFNLLEQEV